MGELMLVLFSFFAGGVVFYLILRNNPTIKTKIDGIADWVAGMLPKRKKG